MTREERTLAALESLTSVDHGAGIGIYIMYKKNTSQWMYKYHIRHDGAVLKWHDDVEFQIIKPGRFTRLVALSVMFK